MGYKRVHFYSLSDGFFTGAAYCGPEEFLSVPIGCGMFEGNVDYATQMVDVSSGRVVEYKGAARVDNQARDARCLRNDLLLRSDGMIMPFLESGKPIPDELLRYRKALRDIPSQNGFPLSIDWPNI